MSNNRIVIVGLGSIGSRHLNSLMAMGCKDIIAVDTREMPNEERVPVLSDVADVMAWVPTHAIICTPPEWHYHHAKRFLERGISTFIEKPMTVESIEARELNKIAEMAGAKIAVGYMERAHPHVQEARRWAIAHYPYRAEFFCYWRTTEKTYGLDVMRESSHAIDTALYVMGSATGYKRCGRTGPRADIMIEHGRAQSEIAMDMDASPRRRIKLFADELYFEQDYGATPEEWTECYRAELQAFLDGKPLCTGQDGLNVVDVIEALS